MGVVNFRAESRTFQNSLTKLKSRKITQEIIKYCSREKNIITEKLKTVRSWSQV